MQVAVPEGEKRPKIQQALHGVRDEKELEMTCAASVSQALKSLESPIRKPIYYLRGNT